MASGHVSCFFSLLRGRLEVMAAKKNAVRSFLRPLLPSATYAGYVFSAVSCCFKRYFAR